MDTKLKGDIAEQSVLLKALKLGYEVLVPIGDRLPYDLVLNKDQTFLKIQVKAAWKDPNKHNYVVDVRRTKTNRKQMQRSYYHNQDFDFAIIFIDDLEIFYVMPLNVFNDYKSEIHFVERSNRQRLPKSAEYREAWHLIDKALSR